MNAALLLLLRIVLANMLVVGVNKLLENLGMLGLSPFLQMLATAGLTSLLAWLRNQFGDVLSARGAGGRFVSFVLRVVGQKL